MLEQGASLAATANVDSIEAPTTWKAYLMCAFASFGGICFGYDSGYINGVTGSHVFIQNIEGVGATSLSGSHQSLIVSVLSAGTCIGAIVSGDLADFLGRKRAIMVGCVIYTVGVILQTASSGLTLIVAGRVVAGLGVGIITAICVLYMSEIAPRKFRGAIVGGYEFCITIGILIASCINYGTQNLASSASYRVPIAIQFLWSTILVAGLIFLPESPRYWVKRGQVEQARQCLATLRTQSPTSQYIEAELAEIIANEEYERVIIPDGGWLSSWMSCFKGSVWQSNSSLRKTILGTSLQMMQQWTGVNFVFYYSTTFLATTGAISNTFLISLIFSLVNVLSTPLALYAIERYGRRSLLIWGALGMLVCEFIVAVVGTTVGFNKTHLDPAGHTIANNPAAVNAQVAFICIYIFFFATTWGPAAWVVIGEIFPLPIRARGVALSTSSNWLWNCIIAVITPYMVNANEGNLKSDVFFVWGGLCTTCLVYAYFLVPETKGLSLEQIDKMMDETTARNSAKWKPTTTFAADAGLVAGLDVQKATEANSSQKIENKAFEC